MCYREVLGFLANVSERTENLRLCFSARPQIRVQKFLKQVTGIEISIHIKQNISNYIKNDLFLHCSREVRKVPNQKQAEELYEILREQVLGMRFLV